MTIVLPTSNAILATTLSAHFSLHKARVKVIQREIPEVHSHHNSVERLPTPQPLASHKRATPTWPSVPNQGRKKRLAKLEPTPRLTLSAPPDATQPDTTSLEVEPPDGYHTQAAPAGKNFTPPEPGTSNLEKNLGHLALEEEAKQSISKEPNSLSIVANVSLSTPMSSPWKSLLPISAYWIIPSSLLTQTGSTTMLKNLNAKVASTTIGCNITFLEPPVKI